MRHVYQCPRQDSHSGSGRAGVGADHQDSVSRGSLPKRPQRGIATQSRRRRDGHPFTGERLVYHAAGSGWVLYSVGPDRKDDGGKARPYAKDDDKGFDLVCRFLR
jgi:hypothetical protein